MLQVSQIGLSPFNPVNSFTALACGMERITFKDTDMPLDLVHAIHCAGHCRDALVSARAARVVGEDPQPFVADAIARFKDQATALGFLIEPVDDVAQSDVEGRREHAA